MGNLERLVAKGKSWLPEWAMATESCHQLRSWLAVAIVMPRFKHREAPQYSQVPRHVGEQGPFDETARAGR
jgi:hypothetical protein